MTAIRLGLAVVLGVSAATFAAPVPKEKAKTTADKLVGKWDLHSLRGGERHKVGVAEFTKDGKLTVTQGSAKYAGKFKCPADDKIDYELDRGEANLHKEVLTIEKLTDDELITVDPAGVKEVFVRQKEKKDEKKEEQQVEKK